MRDWIVGLVAALGFLVLALMVVLAVVIDGLHT